MKGSESRGYKVSDDYAQEMLKKAENRVVDAVKAIKTDIDSRKSSYS